MPLVLRERLVNERLQARAELSREVDWCAVVTGGLTGLLGAVAIRQMARRIVESVHTRWNALMQPLAAGRVQKRVGSRTGF